MLNKENLLLAADFVEAIPQGMFDMEFFREGDESTIHCGSVGCVLGHITQLFPDGLPRHTEGDILFWELPYTLFGFEDTRAENYCFASEWSQIDNTPLGAATRLRFAAENGEEATRAAWKQVCETNRLVF